MFEDFLMWLIASGGSIAAVSWILERVAWFQNQPSQNKDYIIFGLSVVVGIFAQLLLTYLPKETIEVITPYFAIVSSIFGTVFLAKGFHKVDKANS